MGSAGWVFDIRLWKIVREYCEKWNFYSWMPFWWTLLAMLQIWRFSALLTADTENMKNTRDSQRCFRIAKASADYRGLELFKNHSVLFISESTVSRAEKFSANSPGTALFQRESALNWLCEVLIFSAMTIAFSLPNSADSAFVLSEKALISTGVDENIKIWKKWWQQINW